MKRMTALMSLICAGHCASPLERYQHAVHGKGQAMLRTFDHEALEKNPEELGAYLEACNQKISDMAQEETADFLSKVLYQASMGMKNAFARSDA